MISTRKSCQNTAEGDSFGPVLMCSRRLRACAELSDSCQLATFWTHTRTCKTIARMPRTDASTRCFLVRKSTGMDLAQMRDDDDIAPEERSGESNETAFDRALFDFVEHGDQARFERAPIYGGRYSIADVHRADEAVWQAGFVRGRHFGQWYEDVLRLKRQGCYDEALELLLEIIDATERAQGQERTNIPITAAVLSVPEIEVDVREPPTTWTQQAAIIYRKLNRLDDEIAIIDRWLAHADSPTQRARRAHAEFVARRRKAEAIRSKRQMNS